MVLPRILTVAEIAKVHADIPCEIEAFIFGNIGMMAEGRCALTNYITGQSTNMDGVCSPASEVHYEEDAQGNLSSRLGDFSIDCFGPANRPAIRPSARADTTPLAGRPTMPSRNRSALT